MSISETYPIAETEQAATVSFNISRFVEVAPEVEAATKSAITSVWAQHVGTPTSVNVVFRDSILLELPNGNTELLSGLYESGTDTISLALGTLRQRHPEMSLEQACVMYAGHEARHKVQTALGDAPPDTRLQMVNGTYENSRHEVEAWQSSVQAYMAVYHRKWLSFRVGQYGYSTL